MSEPFQSYGEMADEADKYAIELQGWLETFSQGKKKRPDHEISSKTRRLAWANKVSELCRRAQKAREM
jgi:hypothetical protein